MDTTVGLIADYAHGLRFSDLPASVVHQCKRTVVDALGCALGAYDAEPSRIARAMAERAHVAGGARVMGTSHRTLPELAAFANGVMVRYLDGNDAYQGGGGHPSDTLGALMAAADIQGASGTELLTGIALAYEVYYNLWQTARVRRAGIDHVFYTVVGSAVGAAKILGLDRARIVEAIALGLTPNIPLDATRYGILGMWKGCAGANAARNGLFAALLAQAGMTGPEKPIEGDHGLQRLIGSFEPKPFCSAGAANAMNELTLKSFLCEGHALSPITVAVELSQHPVNVEDIEKVTIYTYYFAWELIGREPEKWHPTTHEAADHSMPYIVAAVLVKRGFSDDLYAEECLRDPRIRQLLDKTRVEADPELTRAFPERMPCRIELTLRNGERRVAHTDYPRGHFANPMSDSEVNAKFEHLAQRALPQDRTAAVRETLWRLDSAPNLDPVFESLRMR